MRYALSIILALTCLAGSGCNTPQRNNVIDIRPPVIPDGYRQYHVAFRWWGPAGDCEINVSDGGTNWQTLGSMHVVPGTNEIYLVIPDWYLALPDARPMLRVITKDLEYGFGTVLYDLKQQYDKQTNRY